MSASYEQLTVASRAEWRAWLEEHQASSPGVWLVTWKRDRGPHVDYEDVVEEALCFGWIEPDDLRAALDASPVARAAWDGFPPSARKTILGWIVTAKTAPTRERRVATTVGEAAQGRRAHQQRAD